MIHQENDLLRKLNEEEELIDLLKKYAKTK